MRKMTTLENAKISAALSAINEQCGRDLDDLADRIGEEIVAPFCRKHNLSFLAGMGTYTLSDSEGNTLYDADEVINIYGEGNRPLYEDFCKVEEVLELETIDRSRNPIGIIVPEYREE